MSLKDELHFPNPIRSRSHEAALSIVYTGGILAREAWLFLRPFGLTDSQFNVLHLLRYQTGPDQTATQTELGRMLLVNRSNVTGLVDRMEQAGWVERLDDPADRRIKRIRITAAGRKLLDRVDAAYIRKVEQVMHPLTAREQAELCRLLEKVRAPLDIAPDTTDA
jgi:DNA-binding MarR family transcriptional regulator